MWNSVQAVLLILMMVAVGYIFGRIGWLKKEHKSFISKFIINLAVPCVCLENILSNFTPEMLKEAGPLLLVPALYEVFAYIVAYALGKLLKLKKERFGIFVVMCAFSNSIFIGYPVCMELFGEAGIPFVMYFYVFNTICFWLLGATTIYNNGANSQSMTLGQKLKKLVSPVICTLIVAVILMLLKVQLPAVVMKFCGYMSDTVSPLALIYVGFIMYETGFKSLKLERDMVIVCVMRLVLMPALMYLGCVIFNVEGIERGVFFIESAMPVMTQAVVVAGIAGGDEKFGAAGLCLTTILSFVVIPVLMAIV